LNCVRLLTRILSVLFEEQADSFAEEFLWHGRIPQRANIDLKEQAHASQSAATVDNPAQAAPASASASASAPAPAPAAAAAAVPATPVGIPHTSADIKTDDETDPTDLEANKPMAEQIIVLLTELLFVPHFTIDEPTVNKCENLVHLGKLWPSNVSSPARYDMHRFEVVRCLLVCFSEGLFQRPEEYLPSDNKWLATMVNIAQNPLSMTLFYSVLNTVCSYEPVGMVPYAHMIWSDHRQPLVEVCLQLLLIVLDYYDITQLYTGAEIVSRLPPGITGDAALDRVSPPSVAATSDAKRTDIRRPDLPNIFRECLVAIDKDEDLHVIYEGIANLLNNEPDARRAFLRASSRTVTFHDELLVFLWRMIDENIAFRQYILRQPNLDRLILPVIFHMYESRNNPTKIGTLYTCVFILLRLSAERSFAVMLNRPYTTKLPIDIPAFEGCLADLLYITVHKLVVSTPDRLASLLNVLLLTLANVSPYIKCLSMLASVKLLSLFELFSSPKFLYANESNHQYVFLLLEVMNNMLLHQYAGNSRLIYAIMRRAEVFYRLARMPTQRQPQDGNNVNAAAAAAAAADDDDDDDDDIADMKHADVVVDQTSTQAPAQTQTPSHDVHELPSASESTPAGVWVPTIEWALSWKQRLPLGPIFKLLDFFLPQVEALCNDHHAGDVSEAALLSLIDNNTLVGILPTAHPFCVHRYNRNSSTVHWFTTFLWSVVYQAHMTYPLFDGHKVKLFVLHMVNPQRSVNQQNQQYARVARVAEHKAQADEKSRNNAATTSSSPSLSSTDTTQPAAAPVPVPAPVPMRVPESATSTDADSNTVEAQADQVLLHE
jgi:Dyggve-Melchior-Clausen syndrome protein